MGYNYSPWYLEENKDAVRWLVQIAGNAEVGHKTFTSPDDARAYRGKILSLLACLVRNHPDMAWVKNRLRTWIAYDGRYTVNVGIPPSGLKLRGPKPVAVEVGVASSEVLEIEEILSMKEMSILGNMIAGRTSQKELIVKVPPTPEGIQYIAAMVNKETKLGFEVLSTEPHLRLKLRRIE